MAEFAEAIINIDGGSRGNPGPASYAVVLRREGLPTIEECDTLGMATNNVAEYTALIRALELAASLGLKKLEIQSDSELLVKQMNGLYRVKSPELLELFQQASQLRKQFESVQLVHVGRELNKAADRLCNEALDGRSLPRGTPAGAVQAREVLGSPAREQALAVLADAAETWARHGLASPDVESVLAKIEALLAKK